MQTESNVSLLTNCRVQLIFCKDSFFTPNNQPFGTKRMIEARLTYHRSCQEQTSATLLYKLKPLPLQAPKDVKGEAKNYQKSVIKHIVSEHTYLICIIFLPFCIEKPSPFIAEKVKLTIFASSKQDNTKAERR